MTLSCCLYPAELWASRTSSREWKWNVITKIRDISRLYMKNSFVILQATFYFQETVKRETEDDKQERSWVRFESTSWTHCNVSAHLAFLSPRTSFTPLPHCSYSLCISPPLTFPSYPSSPPPSVLPSLKSLPSSILPSLPRLPCLI